MPMLALHAPAWMSDQDEKFTRSSKRATYSHLTTASVQFAAISGNIDVLCKCALVYEPNGSRATVCSDPAAGLVCMPMHRDAGDCAYFCTYGKHSAEF